MYHCIKVTCLAAACASAQALPTGCSDDAHCSSGFFCSTVERLCRECLRCEDLNRVPPVLTTACITSVAECRSCYTGFVKVNRSNSAACVLPDALGDDGAPLPYGMVAAIVVLLLLTLAVCFAAIYALRNFKTYRLLASSLMASVPSRREDGMAMATAPLPPPPYNTAALLPAVDSRTLDQELRAPFIKPVRSPRCNERESAGTQAARVFHNPAYMNVGNSLPSYEIAALDGDVHGTVPLVRDEEAMDMTNNNTVFTQAAVAMTEELRTNEQPMGHPSVAKTLRVRQDSSNNSDDSGESGESGGSYSGRYPSFLAQNSSPFIINVIKNVTTVQQHNDV